MLTSKGEYIVKRSSIVDEITTVLSEWGNLFKKFYLTNHEIFQPIRHKILELIGLRSQILSGNLPVDEMKKVKLMATSEIDTGNKILGGWFAVRIALASFSIFQSNSNAFVVNTIYCRFGHGCTRWKWQYFGYDSNIHNTTLWASYFRIGSDTKSNGKRRHSLLWW